MFWSESQNLTNPQSFNTYSYAENNPINKEDPSGLKTTAAQKKEIKKLQKQLEATQKQLIRVLTRKVERLNNSSFVRGFSDPIGTIQSDSSTRGQRAGAATNILLTYGSFFIGYGEVRTTELALGSRARQISEVLDPIAQNRRTTAILRTSEGDIVAGGGRDLTGAQKASLWSGEVAATAMPGAHAEVTALTQAATSQSTPQMLVASRPICPSCQAFIESTGGTVINTVTAIWK